MIQLRGHLGGVPDALNVTPALFWTLNWLDL